jgi:hypothetical protein
VAGFRFVHPCVLPLPENPGCSIFEQQRVARLPLDPATKTPLQASGAEHVSFL